MHSTQALTRSNATWRRDPAGKIKGRVATGTPVKPAPVKKHPSFDAGHFLGLLQEETTSRSYTDNQTIFAQGDPADAVFYIESGKVKLTVVSTRGKEAVIAILEKGYFFGEGSLAGQSLRMSTASAVQRTKLVRIRKESMAVLLRSDPGYADHFMQYLLSRNIRIEEDLVDQLFNSSEKRLARLLLLLAHYGKDSKREPVVPKLSQETLAEMIGTTRSRVSFFLNKFRKSGLIDYEGGLHVNPALLSIVLRDKF
jgi:CRP-like cAMP-binding protein